MKRLLRITGIALIAAAASHCGKKSDDDAVSRAKPEATVIHLGEVAKYEGQTEANTDTPAPFTQRHDHMYSLKLDTDSKIQLNQQSSFTAVLKGHKAAGPFVTLIRENAATLTTDSVLVGAAALRPSDLKAALAKGDYQVLVTTYSDDACTSALEFSFVVDNSSPNPPPPPPPPTSTFDKALAGTWTKAETNQGMVQKSKLTFSEAGLMTMQVWVMDNLVVDLDTEITGVHATSPAQATMTIKTIRPTGGQDPMAVGDFNSCIYAIRAGTPNLLDLNCSETNSTLYPLTFDVDTETFSFGDFAVTPPPATNAIIRDFPGLNLAIPDGSSSGVALNLAVPNTGSIRSINAQFTITHRLPNDLVVSLIHPDGTEVILLNRVSRAAGTFSMNLGDGGTAFSALSSFTGKPVAGTWRLKVTDQASSDIGTLDGAKITFNLQ